MTDKYNFKVCKIRIMVTKVWEKIAHMMACFTNDLWCNDYSKPHVHTII